MSPADIRKWAEDERSICGCDDHTCDACKAAERADALADVVEAAKAHGPFREGSVLGAALARVEALEP